MTITMSRPGLRWLMTGLLVTGVGFCVAVLWRLLDGDIALRPVLGPAVAIGACYLTSVTLASLLWRQLVYAGRAVRLSWAEALVGLAALMIGKYVPGKVVGLLGRAATLRGHAPPAVAAALTVVEQAYVFAGLVGFAAIASLATGNRVWAPWLLAAVLLAVVLAPYALRRWMSGIRIESASWREARALCAALAPSVSLRLFVVASLTATSVCLPAWFAPELLGMTLDAAVRLGLVAAYAGAIVLGILAVVLPGGIGAREGAFVVMAQPWLATDEALALAAALRLLNVVADIVFGVTGIVIWRSTNGRSG